MKHIIHTGIFDFPDVSEILGKVNKIKHKDNGLEVEATIDTEKLEKFMEKLDAWERSERAESSVLEVPKGLRVTSFVLTKEIPDDFDVIEELEEFCEEHCVQDIKFFDQSETSTYVIVVYKD